MKARLTQTLLSSLFLAACASSPPPQPRVWSETPDSALLLLTPAFELHLREGQVELITPAEDGGPTQVRIIQNIEELRRLYASSAGATLPESNDGAPIKVNGWAGLECVRAGNTCGVAPTEPPSALFVLRSNH